MAHLTAHWERYGNHSRRWMTPVLLETVAGTTVMVAGIAVTGPATARETAIAVDDILW
jgi:hypothetical protein